MPKQSNLAAAAAQHCVGADGTEAICESSRLSAAAQLHRYAAMPSVGVAKGFSN
ncbi:MAG: hypothetical protein HC840_14350 [Leptolyngbyaceae cyanobacterium RM2_2_4]|nr:hypothetical protein [Leptolyngbyaceae cyanobacterium SM1_4_3]NJO50417.1 hypothetical protein [Leptolyngbyaceae cyanobacterium RM2_2_4]